MEPLLGILREKPNAVAMSQLDTINAQTFAYEFTRQYRARYGFDWRLQFFETEYRPDQLVNGDLVLPYVNLPIKLFFYRIVIFKF